MNRERKRSPAEDIAASLTTTNSVYHCPLSVNMLDVYTTILRHGDEARELAQLNQLVLFLNSLPRHLPFEGMTLQSLLPLDKRKAI